eukprot:10257068-Prorocentrum_lima.AAC.1
MSLCVPSAVRGASCVSCVCSSWMGDQGVGIVGCAICGGVSGAQCISCISCSCCALWLICHIVFGCVLGLCLVPSCVGVGVGVSVVFGRRVGVLFRCRRR